MLSNLFMDSFPLSVSAFSLSCQCFVALFPTSLNLISTIWDSSPLPSITSALSSPSCAWIRSPTCFTPTLWLLSAMVSSSTSWAVQRSSVYSFQTQLSCQCCSPNYTGAFCLPGRTAVSSPLLSHSVSQWMCLKLHREMGGFLSLITVQICSLRFVNL